MFHLQGFVGSTVCSLTENLTGHGFVVVFWYGVDLSLDYMVERKISGFISITVFRLGALGPGVICCAVVLKDPCYGPGCCEFL